MFPIMPHTDPTRLRMARATRSLAQAIGLAVCSLLPAGAAAQGLMPHVARYEVRLGTQPGAPKIGAAQQRLTHDCQTWRIERDVQADIGVIAGLRLAIDSRLKGEETRAAGRFSYSLVRQAYGTRHSISGTVERRREGGKATFNIKLESTGGAARPQTVLALVSREALPALSGPNPAPAGDFFANLKLDLARQNGQLGIGIKYFRIE